MSRRYLGGFITANPVTPTASAASGAWTLNQQMQANAAGNWPTGFGDPYFNYTSMLLSSTSLSGANNNLFVDSSGAYNVVNRNGNTTQGAQTPYGSYWSNYFDGSGDYLTLSSGANFAFGTGDFTVEMWVNFANADGTPFYFMDARNSGQTGAWAFYRTISNTLGWFNGSSELTTAFTSRNTWNHIAYSRSGTTGRLFINGTLSTSWTDGTNYSISPTTSYIGCRYNVAEFVNGYISNLRVVKGTALYTAAFTPPTVPLTAVTNTSLLTCQSNRFRDASAGNLTITPNGDTRVTNYAPFLHTAEISYNQSDIQYWSGYFDGSGDYLTAPTGSAFQFGTASFTVEMWVNIPSYPTGSSPTTYYTLFDGCPIGGSGGRSNAFVLLVMSNGTLQVFSQSAFQTASTSTVPLGQWVHIALVRNGSTTATYYINGVAAGTTNLSADMTTGGCVIGRLGDSSDGSMLGYLSNHRIVKGTAVYTSGFTPPTAPLTAVSGTSLLTCQNAAFTDNSTNNFPITINGNTTVTGNNPFQTGYYSNYFDGSGDYLNVATNAALSLGTGDLTCEAWVWITGGSGNRHIFSGGTNNAFGFYINSGGKIAVAKSGVVEIIASTTTIPLNTWTNVAVSRSGNTFRIFVNGTLEATVTSSQDFTTSNDNRVGFENGSSAYMGYISNLRVIKGTALYAATFTPSTTPLTAVSGTSLLTCQSNRLIDTSANALAITKNGDVSIQSFDPFYAATIASNGGSMYFDGSDWLAVPDSPILDFGTSDFTIEAWVYFPSAVSTTQVIMAGWTAGEPVSGWSLYADNTSFGFVTAVSASYISATNSAARTPGAWHHVAAVRSSGSVTLYVNGVAGTAVANTQSVNTGPTGMEIARSPYTANRAYMTGYIASPRITRSAVYTSNFTPPTAPYSPSANTALLVNGMNAGIYDATAINDLETVGDAKVSTAVSKFGGSSMAFDGTGDYLQTRRTSETTFGSANFTIEAWVYTASSSYGGVFSTRGNAGIYDGVVIQARADASNAVRLLLTTTGSSWEINLSSGGAISANTWTHIAWVRNGTSFVLYVNGTSAITNTVSGSVYQNTTSVYVGTDADGAFNGYIDDFRITKGYARYTANFTPPTAALPTF